MSVKRRDSKGRVLHDNEFQRKDGRYEYRCYDENGNLCSIYSWRLTSADAQPAGKRFCEPLRDLEKQERKKQTDDTLNDCWDRYIESRPDLKFTTAAAYRQNYDKHVRTTLGKRPIVSIRYSDLKNYYLGLVTGDDAMQRINAIHCLLNPTFDMAKRDGLIVTNPLDGILTEMKRFCKRPEHQKALTIAEQREFVQWLSVDPLAARWSDLFLCLLWTGCRVSEMLGLMWEDVDWQRNVIHVRHSLAQFGQESRLTGPKTSSGIRDIPMFDSVRKILLKSFKMEATGYIWEQDGKLPSRHAVYEALKRTIERHNRVRPDNPLPIFSVHQLRHTFCVRMCEHETDLKLIQEIMGHSSIRTTMDIYNESNPDRKQESFKRLQSVFTTDFTTID